VVSCILEDERGNLWMSTNNGVSKFDTLLQTFKHYSTADGLPGNDLTGWGSCSKSSSGEMFFGGFRGRSLYRKSPSQREPIDVNQVIHEMLNLLKGAADRCSVTMRMEPAAELPKIQADRVQLQQVFMNLILNAIEAMDGAGGELTVKSQLGPDRQLLFAVSDTGPGPPAGNVDQTFSVFFTTKPQGSGMGLAISCSIVESHGGRLWASANDGRGATFHFTLPIQAIESSP
jgi:signal transduction histidine kinase